MQDAQSKDLPHHPSKQYSSGLSATTLWLDHPKLYLSLNE